LCLCLRTKKRDGNCHQERCMDIRYAHNEISLVEYFRNLLRLSGFSNHE
jgi:hypothetical protein